jgi:hypothetical protein
MNKPEYDISEYTDKELYDILDLVNPSDRELEAKILMKLREYNNGNGNGKNDGLIDFLNQIYHHFFEESDEDEEEDTLVEGFTAQSETQNSEQSATPTTIPGSKPGQVVANQTVSAIQTTTIDYPKGNLNPQPGGGKETRQRTIVINSIERDSNLYPNSCYFSGDLDETLFNVVALKYFSISVPYAWYNVTKEFGANFIYISGTSPGINNGNFNYKLQIQPGQYVLDSKNTDYDIITAIQIAIAKMKQTYSDVNFGTTDISLNYTFTQNDPSSKPRDKKATFIFDIQNIYDATNYYLNFPTWSNPYGSDRSTTIPGYLGILYTTIIPSAIYSNQSQCIQQTGLVTPAGQPVVPITFDLTSTIFKIYYDDITPYLKNSYFTIYNYQDNANVGFANNILSLTSTIVEGSTSVSVISTENIVIGSSVTGNGIPTGTTVLTISNLTTPTITISQAALTSDTLSLTYISPNVKDIITVQLPSISSKKTSRPAGYTRNDLISIINTTLTTNSYLDKSSSITIQNIRYTDSSGNITTYQQFKLNIVLNRKTTTQLPNMKQYIVFPIETGIDFPVWTGSTSSFLFDPSLTEVNNILSTNSPASMRYLITSTPTILLTCTTNPLYSYAPFSLPAPVNPGIGYTKQEYIQAIQTAFQTGIGAANILFFSIYEDISATTTPAPTPSQTKLVIKLEIYRNIGGGKNLSELDYIISFQDTISPTSWFTNLGLESQYIMRNKPQHLLGNSYSQITATNPILDAQITVTSANNTFSILPIPNTTGGAYTVTGLNDVNITIPPGTYTKTMLYQAMNTALGNNTISNGSTIQSIWSTDLQTETTNIRLNVNKIYRAQDYTIIFHDDTLFLSLLMDLSGIKTLKPLPWVSTLGWLLGFHSYQKYYLLNDPILNPTILNYKTFNNYTYDPVTGIVTLTGDVKVDVDIVKNLYIIIDDHVQNQMNDGLVTLGPKDTTVTLPYYATASNIRSNPITNAPMINLQNSANPGTLMTVNQVYAAQIQLPRKNYINEKPATPITGAFAIISLKYPLASLYTDNGGTNMQQNRLYPGVVNLKKFTIKIANDYGNLVDLNGDDWTLTLTCDIKYDKNRS